MHAETMRPSDGRSRARREARDDVATGRAYSYVGPADVYETLPERLIREAMEAGEFDDLPGAGKPLPGAGVPDDDLWWVRDWLKRNREERRDGWNSG
jgi:hypothetical protein